MTITLYWWMIPLALLVAPFVYFALHKSEGQWDFNLDFVIILIGSWAGAAAFLLGYFIAP